MPISNLTGSSSVNVPNGSILNEGFTPAPPANREKLTILIDQPSQSDTVDIRMTIPLDEAHPEEREAKKVFGEKLDVQYTVQANLAAEQKEMTDAVNELFRNPSTSNIILAFPLRKLSSNEIFQCFSKIATDGASLYYRLFQRLDEEPNFKFPANFSKLDWPILSGAIRSAFRRPQIISMTSHVPLFPWNFLFLDEKYTDKKGQPDLRQFWGFRHEVQDELPGVARRFVLSSEPTVVTAICPILDSGQWHKAADHPLNNRATPPIPVLTAADFGRKLADLQQECFYFFGHVEHQDPPRPATSKLTLNNQTLSVHELEQQYQAPKYHGNPVVGFLNGCSTAPLQKWNHDSVAGFLSGRGDGRLCCIATTADVPAMFGAEFAIEFWKQFLENKRAIGWSLLKARCDLLDRYENPLGLMYSLYGRADTHLRTET